MKKELKFIIERKPSQIQNAIKFKLFGQNRPVLKFKPLFLLVHLTYRCNLKCPMCAIRSPNKPDCFKQDFEDLKFKDFKKIVDINRAAIAVIFSGGEPFLHKDLFKMIEYVRKMRMKTSIYTNGTFLDENMDKIFKNNVNRVAASVDACNSSEYEIMHGAPEKTYKKVIKNIEAMVDARKSFDSNMIIELGYICTMRNYKSIPKMIDLALELGVDVLTFRNLIPFGIPDFGKDQCLFHENPKVRKFINSINPPKGKLIVSLPKLYKKNSEDRSCAFPFRYLVINGNGDQSVCCRMPPDKANGNIFNDEDIWNNKAFRDIRKVLLDRKRKMPDACLYCNNRFSERRNLNGNRSFEGVLWKET